MIILKSNTGMLPGGLIFVDPRVGEKKWDDTSSFIDERVKEVIRFRLQNPTIYDINKDSQYFDPAQVREEIVMFNYQRLGGMPEYFINSDAVSRQNPVSQEIRCKCNVELKPRLCPTCGGAKVIGYICPSCGQNYSL